MRSRHTKRDFVFASLRVGSLFYAIDIGDVKEVVKHTCLHEAPSNPGFIQGFVKLRGLAVPVIDLRKRFGMPPAEGGKIIVTQIDGRVTGLAVDDVNEVASGSRETMIKPGSRNEPWNYCVEAILDSGGLPVHILNLGELLEEEEKKVLGAFTASVETM